MKHSFEDIRDAMDPVLKEKICKGIKLTPEEILAVKIATDLGDTCGCDDDHHGHDVDDDFGSKKASFDF
jgi:hypothetical protein